VRLSEQNSTEPSGSPHHPRKSTPRLPSLLKLMACQSVCIDGSRNMKPNLVRHWKFRADSLGQRRLYGRRGWYSEPSVALLKIISDRNRSSGYMCVKGWKMDRFNPSKIPVITHEMDHEPEFLDLRGGPKSAG
jgi:hypothetical protein